LIEEFDRLWLQARGAFRQDRVHQRARSVAKGALTCLGRHTLTGMLTAAGRQFVDWSSAYRLFGKNRVDTEKLFDVIRTNVLEELPDQDVIVAHMDDTIIRKKGKRVFGTAWRRDPLGPPFHTNFIWGQRFLQISLALPDHSSNCQSKAIPVDFHHCPTITKPKKKALPHQISSYKEQQKNAKLSRQGSLRIAQLRDKLNLYGEQKRKLIVSVDGSYTNSEVLKTLPPNVTLIGRIRKDSKLFKVPTRNSKSAGRKRVYGEQLPSPENIRKSGKYRWEKATAWAAGKTHEFNVKIVKNVRWRSAGESNTMQLVIIRPLAYRLNKTSPILYRQPGYLVCTDTQLPVEKLLQAYLWRWEIEVNFRDEKTLMGCGEAQVRTENAVKNVPAFMGAIYSLIHLAAHRSNRNRDDALLPRPIWYPAKPSQRPTSSEIINTFRAQNWCAEANSNFSGFIKKQLNDKGHRNISNQLLSAMFYSRK
jgi:hypothetical protein